MPRLGDFEIISVTGQLPDQVMNAASIVETCGRGVPATLDTAMIVDVCAYLRSTQSPMTLVITSGGDVKGMLSNRDIVHASGRLGSSVMQMTAAELMREQVPVCQGDAAITEVLEMLTETGSDFVLVCEGSLIKGIVTLHDVTELLMQVLNGDEGETAPEQPQPVEATPVPAQTMAQAAQPHPDAAAVQLAQPEYAQSQPALQTPHQPAITPAAAFDGQQQWQPEPPAQPVMQQPQAMQQSAALQPQYAMPVPEVPAATAFAPMPAQQQPAQPVQQQPAQPAATAAPAAWASYSS